MVGRDTYVYVPPGWPDEVAPPGSEEWEASAAAFPVKFICSAWRHRMFGTTAATGYT